VGEFTAIALDKMIFLSKLEMLAMR